MAASDSDIALKLDALEMIFGALQWPKRDELSANGAALFDAITKDAKEYCLKIAAIEFDAAFAIAAGWSSLVNALMDGERIDDNEAAKKLLLVYEYYCNLAADFSQVERA